MRIKRFSCGNYGLVASRVNKFTGKLHTYQYAVLRENKQWSLYPIIADKTITAKPFVSKARTLRECLCIAAQKLEWIL